MRLRKAGKPVVASMSSIAASGGYYIAMDADEIWASPATLTGSIGVFAVFPTVERTLDKFGITIDGVGTTPLADSLRLDRTLQRRREGDPAVVRRARVHASSSSTSRPRARNRSTTSTRSRRAACGPASTRPSTAWSINLGSYKDALDAAAKRAKLGEDYEVEYIEPPLGWREAIAMQSQALAARFARALAPERQLLTQRATLVRAAGSGARAAVAVHGSEAGVLLLSVRS